MQTGRRPRGNRGEEARPSNTGFRTVPGFGDVRVYEHLAFPSLTQESDGTWIALPFTSAEIEGSRTLICPHCQKEWPEECRCPGRFQCDCWRCMIGALEYFEPARDREKEGEIRRHNENIDFLNRTLGPNYWQAVDATGEIDEIKRVLVAAHATRWAASASVFLARPNLLEHLYKMSQSDLFELGDFITMIVELQLPTLLDPYGRQLKKRQQAVRLIQSAYKALELMRQMPENRGR